MTDNFEILCTATGTLPQSYYEKMCDSPNDELIGTPPNVDIIYNDTYLDMYTYSYIEDELSYMHTPFGILVVVSIVAIVVVSIIFRSVKKKKAKEGVVFNYKDIDISDESEKDIWVLFSDLYNLLVKEVQDNDICLFVDITHSFRYLPMFLIVFINYVKLFKNVTVEHISYGNYEGRDKKTNVAPIVELTDYSKLQDWTYAVRTYTESGNVKSLEKLLSKSDSDLFDAIKIMIFFFYIFFNCGVR